MTKKQFKQIKDRNEKAQDNVYCHGKHEVGMLIKEIEKLRKLLGDTRAFLAIHVWDNERSCCFYCGEKDYGVTADDCRQAPDYELAKKIDEVLK